MTDQLSTDAIHHDNNNNNTALGTPDAMATEQNAKSTQQRRRCGRLEICEVLVLTPVMLAILGLFLIPTVYYTAYSRSAERDLENITHVTAPHVHEDPGHSSQLAYECSEGFFFDENGTRLCRPICGEINPKHIALQVLENASVCACFVASVLMFALALTVQRDSLLVFPATIFVYVCVTTFILSGVFIAGFFNTTALFCGSKDMIHVKGQGNETAFCTLTGMVFTYCLEQITIWGVLHAVFLFWAIVFPFSFRQLKISGRMRYAHIISVILAVVFPLPAALVHLKDGYVVNADAALNCFGRNFHYTYYTFILPISIALTIGSSLLVLTIWTIFKEFVLKKLHPRNKARKAQIKITVIAVYYILYGIAGLVGYTYFGVNVTRLDNRMDYITCESHGTPNNCTLDASVLNIKDGFSVISSLMLTLMPMVALFFSFSPQACKGKFDSVKNTVSSRIFIS